MSLTKEGLQGVAGAVTISSQRKKPYESRSVGWEQSRVNAVSGTLGLFIFSNTSASKRHIYFLFITGQQGAR